MRSARSASSEPAALRCSSAPSRPPTSPAACASSPFAMRACNCRRVAGGVRSTTRSRIRSWAILVTPPTSMTSPRSASSAVAPAVRSGGHPVRRSSSIGSIGRARIASVLRSVPASAPRPATRPATTSPMSPSWRWPWTRTSSQNGDPPARSHNPAASTGPIPRLRLATKRTPAARSSGRTDSVRGAIPSPRAAARDVAKRSAMGDGRDATTSARPRPEPAVARTR